MWQQGWPPASDGGGSNSYDWGAAAQQWLKNKQLYEEWQQQQYQQQVQMMAAHAASIANCIDPNVVTNPPPPPPLPTENSDDQKNESVNKNGSLGSSTSNAPLVTDASLPKRSFKSRFSNAPLIKKDDSPAADSSTSKKPLFAAYDQSNNKVKLIFNKLTLILRSLYIIKQKF
jgi:hypothetical protein